MEWDAVAAIAELFGAFAVLITVAYLAVQIGQNTRALKFHTARAVFKNHKSGRFHQAKLIEYRRNTVIW